MLCAIQTTPTEKTKKKSKNKHNFVLPALIQINQENISSTYDAIDVDFISLKAEGKEAKSPVVSIQSLQCRKAMTFENCHILLRIFNVHFLPRSVLFHQSFGTSKWSGFQDENQVHKRFSSRENSQTKQLQQILALPTIDIPRTLVTHGFRKKSGMKTAAK